MRLKVTDSQINKIERNSKSILMSTERRIFVIDDYTVEECEEPKKTFLKKSKELVKNKYLTSAVVLGYNTEGKFLGSMNDQGVENFFMFTNFDKMRQRWLDFKEELKAFHLEIKHVEEEPEALK